MSIPNEITLVKVYDKKVVTLISSVSNGTPTDSGKVNQETQEAVLKPKLTMMYNKYMGDVEANDQLLAFQSTHY